jgi:hypothetical protein
MLNSSPGAFFKHLNSKILYKKIMKMCEINVLEIEIFNFLNKLFT